MVGLGTATAYALVLNWLKDLPDLANPQAFKVAQTTRIYSADGKLLANLYLENRQLVSLQNISPYLRQAVVAVEDERFYEHKGIDVEGIVRAAVKDVLSGSVEEGASTITQQYIRGTVLSSEKNDITIARKVREMYLAQELEKRVPKDKILEMYLNTVYYGESAYGAEMAARTYFKKSARKLTIAESALIAGLPQSPTRLNPYENPKAALGRRNWVLRKMYENRFISYAQYQKAKNTPVAVKPVYQPMQGVYRAHYFVSYVKRLLQDRYSTATVFKGGLKVFTTIDTRMQAQAEKAAKGHLGRPDDPEYALVSIDPNTGQIKALVGGKDYRENKFNYATQARRQPGSSFKTFALVTALEKGIPPYRTFNSSSPATIKVRGYEPWVVNNSEGEGGGMMSLAEATKLSVNCVFARLMQELGPKTIVKTAHRMGITSNIHAFPSVVLGSQIVTPLEMASAYGTIAANGVHHDPEAIAKIVNADGKVIYRAKKAGKRVLTERIAAAATRILQGVIQDGTATRANIQRPAAGKTGTSQTYRDAWFVGYTPQLVTAVWVGYKVERPMFSVHGMRGFGGLLAAPIWHDYMSAVLAGQPVMAFKGQPTPAYKWKSSWSRDASSTASGGAQGGSQGGTSTGKKRQRTGTGGSTGGGSGDHSGGAGGGSGEGTGGGNNTTGTP